MPKPEKHVFICTNQRPEGHPRGSCMPKNAMNVWQKFSDGLFEKQMLGSVALSGVRSCMGPCQAGPIVVVYPDNVWYAGVTENDIDEILENHLKNGEPVERLIMPEEMLG